MILGGFEAHFAIKMFLIKNEKRHTIATNTISTPFISTPFSSLQLSLFQTCFRHLYNPCYAYLSSFLYASVLTEFSLILFSTLFSHYINS